MKNIVISMFLLSSVCSFSQTDKEEIARLKQENEYLKQRLNDAQSKAEEFMKRAERLRGLALADMLAVTSLKVQDYELAGLLALQSNRLNVVSGGYEWNDKIFGALSYSLNQLGFQSKTARGSFRSNTTSTEFSAKSESNGIIELKSNSRVIKLAGHTLKVNHIAFSNSGKYMVSSDLGRKTLLWSMENLTRPPRYIVNAMWDIESLKFSEDDTELLVSYSNGKMAIFQLDHWKMVAEIEKRVTRNLTKEEWQTFIAPDLPYEKTIDSLPEGN